jgi:hypothetical protein
MLPHLQMLRIPKCWFPLEALPQLNISQLVYQILIYNLDENSRFIRTTLVAFVCLRVQVKVVRFGQEGKHPPRTNLTVTHWPHHTPKRCVQGRPLME